MSDFLKQPSYWRSMLLVIMTCSMIINLIFTIKKDGNKITTQLFNIILNCSFIGTVLLYASMLLVDKFNITNWIPQLLMRLFLINNNLYITFISIYIITVTHLAGEKNNNKFYKAIRINMWIFLITTLIQAFLPVNLTNCYMDGPGSQFSLLYFALCVPIWIILIRKNIHKTDRKIKLQSFLFISLGVIAMYISLAVPESHVVPIVEFFAIFILYLQNENPDIKYLTELNEIRKETQRALDAKNDFLESMNEELKEPLTKIINSVDKIGKYKEQVIPDVKDDIEYILPTAKNLNEIIGNIIDTNRLENNQIKIYEAPYNPLKLVEEAIEDERQKSINPNIEVILKHDENIPEQLIGDERHTKKIVHNLLSNAFKYTEEGNITVTVLVDRVSYETYNLKIKVTDTGIGIKNDTLITLFTNFSKGAEQKNSNIAGTGLGLSITKKLVDMLDGTITVESIYGSGSTFTVTLPNKIH